MAHIPYDRPPRCLDIAVDHRIRALFKPISKKKNNNDAGIYLKHIQDLGKDILYRDVPNEEISVTQKFIGNGIGGITVILLQPSNSHPYEQDIETIVEKCPTYTALDECFRAVTCNTLSIHDVSILDSLPFIRGRDKITANDKKRVRKWVSLIIEAKKPNVILCMWQDKEGVTLRMSKIQSQGVGGQFDKSPILFGYSVSMERVNAFHPSYAVNYNPNISCFRQLLLLEVTKACHIYEGNWNERSWMSQLRHTCRDKAGLFAVSC